MEERMRRIVCAALLAFVYLVPCKARQQSSDREIIQRARQSYASLTDEGLLEVRGSVQPDWELTYAAVKTDKVATDQLLPILKATHFTVALGPDGAPIVSHESDAAPPNEEVAQRIHQSLDGMDQLLTGFFQTWSNFSFATPLPRPDENYRLEDSDGKYRVSLDQGAAHFELSLSHELAIEEVEVTSAKLSGKLELQWSPSSKGLLLSSYQGTFKENSGGTQQLSVKIHYEDVEGFSLPSTVDATVELPAGSIPLRLVFSDYKIKKR
jgi:hypothetical protein